MKIIYATDLDRTLIFSTRFINEFPPESGCNKEIIELKGNKIISYISSEVKNKLWILNRRDDVEIIPATTRSIEEYNRINLGFKFKYAIVGAGTTILENGEPLKEWEEYVEKNCNRFELIQAKMDLDEMSSLAEEVKVRDSRYLFAKIKKDKLKTFDTEISLIMIKYPNLTFIRQKHKAYVISKSISKEIALRWLYNKLQGTCLVASGDGEVDLGMLAIANYAVVPEHSDLIKEGYVTGGRIANAGINSPLYSLEIVEKLLNNENVE